MARWPTTSLFSWSPRNLTETAVRPTRTGFTLSGRLSVSLAAIAVLTAAALGVAGWAYARQVRARDHLVNVVDRARLVAQSLLADYVNEETGVRGYILSGQVSFLQPYTSGVSSARGDRAKLTALEAEDPESDRLLAGVDAAISKWQSQFALPAIAATRQGDRAFASGAELDAGKNDFDLVRARFNALYQALANSAASSTTTVEDSQDVFIGVAAAVLVLLVASGLGAAWALRSWVVQPVGHLRRDVRDVAAGQLDHPVVPVGPPDLATLAEDVDTMRRRILAEVRSLARASEELTALNADLSRSNRELEQFAYVASHDLQEPLRKVVSFCDLLERRYAGELDERARQYIAFAVDGATRMQTLINDLLAFSRVGRTTSGFEDVPLGGAWAQAVANLERALEEKKATVSAGPLPVVKGDLALLTALFQNLLSNAVKFNRSEVPRVRVTAQRQGGTWELAVTDNGIGIEARFAERVFVIFQRLHGRDEYEGTGIGLALCRKIVEFHGGRIWLDTGYSPGTRICFSLPAIGAA